MSVFVHTRRAGGDRQSCTMALLLSQQRLQVAIPVEDLLFVATDLDASSKRANGLNTQNPQASAGVIS